MALSEKHRSAIYQTLSPVVGEEPMDAWLSQYPTGELDAPATKEFVESKVTAMAAELRAEVGELRTEMGVGFATIRAEMATRSELHETADSLRSEIKELRTHIDAGFERMRGHLIAVGGVAATIAGVIVAVFALLLGLR